ncbi:MAG TPA: uracil phosphoribosyltransferase [Fimbriimonadaceae bacterium]|jgi:uracil phosphoribosyltransferase
MSLTVLDHPLASHVLTKLRDKSTSPESFRRHSNTLTTLLVLEATRNLPTKQIPITTPLEEMDGTLLGQGLAIVPVLRAGLGMLEPIVELFPDVAVGYIGLERHHDTAIAHSYYCKLPNLINRVTLCVDPMLATGGSASQAVSLIKSHGGTNIIMVCVVAAPEGVERLTTDHPDIQIITGALDRGLNEKKYILPGLGDFGDRLYGTF